MNQRGVTLPELMIVLAIVAVLATFFLPQLKVYRMQAQDSRAIDFLGTVYSAVTAYQSRTGGYSGLPSGADSYESLRTTLATNDVQLPAWSEVSGLISSYFGQVGEYWAESSVYLIGVTLTHGTGGMLLATPSGIYKCDSPSWDYAHTPCPRP